MTKLNLGFAGTPTFAIPCLEALYHSEHDIKAVYTQPDRPAGRGRKMQASAVKQWAEAHALPIYQPLNFKDEAAQTTLTNLNLDLMVVIAYGLILPTRILAIPRLGCINVHGSLLPRWRGASPIQQSILHGDAETGITIMQMDKGMDTGNIFMKVTTPIDLEDTTESLQNKLAELAIQPLLETISQLATSNLKATPQNHAESTYAPKLTKEEAQIHWHDSTQIIHQKIRGYYPWPIAYTHLNNIVMRIHHASIVHYPHQAKPGTLLAINHQGLVIATSDGAIQIEVIQFPGTKAMSVADWLCANREIAIGVLFQ
jgi:methionyl-tRNA formyltransferase